MKTSSVQPRVRIEGTNAFAVGSRPGAKIPVFAHDAILLDRPLPLPFFNRLVESRELMGLSGFMPSPAGTIVGFRLDYKPLGKAFEFADPRTGVTWVIDGVPGEAVVGGERINPQTEKRPLVVSIHHFEIGKGRLVFDERGQPKKQYSIAVVEKQGKVSYVIITPNDPGVFAINRLVVGRGTENAESGLPEKPASGEGLSLVNLEVNMDNPAFVGLPIMFADIGDNRKICCNYDSVNRRTGLIELGLESDRRMD